MSEHNYLKLCLKILMFKIQTPNPIITNQS